MSEPERCRWDAETGAYLVDGEPCDVPRNQHCGARRTCSGHLAWGELTCGRCLGRTRTDLRQIVERAALMLPEAMVAGVNSEAAALAGPGTDPEAWTWRKVAAKQQAWYGTGRAWHVSLDDEDDETHPYSLLTRWAQALSEDYKTGRPEVWTVTNAAAFLDRILHRVAHDEEQDFPLLARELRRCRSHLESVMRDSMAPERGVPCPTCVESGTVDPAKVRLSREYPHWCDDEACEQVHVATDELDVWVCPRDRDHWWVHKDYTNRLEERRASA